MSKKEIGRGKGKKLALSHVTMRVPTSVLAYYKTFPSYSQEMRRVLTWEAEKNKL